MVGVGVLREGEIRRSSTVEVRGWEVRDRVRASKRCEGAFAFMPVYVHGGLAAARVEGCGRRARSWRARRRDRRPRRKTNFLKE